MPDPVACPRRLRRHHGLARTLPPDTPGTWEERDNDGDGTADDILYTFPAEELTDKLTLERWLLVQLEAGLADACRCCGSGTMAPKPSTTRSQ